jgi:tetratricopeptide (TPR) repeat protein
MPIAFSGRILVAIVVGAALLSTAACGGAAGRKARHMDKGHAYLAQGNFEKARVEFRNALQIAPNDAEARYENGVVDEKLKNITEAAEFYQGTIDVSPDHLRARTNLARLYLLGGQTPRAADLINPTADKNPNDAEALAVRAAVRSQQQDVAGALADATRAVQLDPANEDAVATLAGIYNVKNDFEKAQAVLESGIKVIPGTVDLRLALAELYARQNKPADAERLLLELVRLEPKEKSHRIRLSQYYARLDQIDAAETVLRQAIKDLPGDASLKVSLVEFLSVRRGPEAAEKEIKGMIAADPKSSEIKFMLAKLYEGTHRTPQAEAVYQEVIDHDKLDPAALSARNRLAALKLQHSDEPAARKLVDEVLAKSPRDNDALILRGNLELANKEPKAAIADLRAVLRDQPNSIPVQRTLARAHLANGEPAIAEETMRRAVDENPTDVPLRLDLAQLLTQLGKPDQAKPILQDLVKGQPDNVAALDALFRVSSMTKDLVTAKSAAEAIVATQPKAAAGYLYEGMLAEEAKHPDEALRLYGVAAGLAPESPEPLKAEVQLLVAQKHVSDALKRLDDAAAKSPTKGFPLSMKGQLLLLQGRVSEAQEAYKSAVACEPKWWESYRGLAEAQLASKDEAGAIATMRNAEKVVDRPDAMGIELAEMLQRLGKPDEAIGEYEALIGRYPRSEVAANNLAMLLATYKNDAISLDRAKTLSARFADSPNPSYLDTYGWVLYKHGEASASVPVLERVVKRTPQSVVALYHLGMAQSQAGSTAQARDNLSRAVGSGVNFAGLDEAKATLDRLAKHAGEAAPKS